MSVLSRCGSTREIQVDGLKKHYPGGVTAVDGVSFNVTPGEIFGFLGPNGAGKSTTIKILTTLALPSAGRATVGGYDVVNQASEVRCISGVALQDVGLDPLLTSMELLTIQARLFGMNSHDAQVRATELLELVRLTDAIDRRVSTYSGGMRRRLDLALALVHEPEILFLDEPTTGLDPASRRDVWNEVRRLNRSLGMTIFLTTQYLEEADELADQIAIIDRGVIQVQGSPARLKASVGIESINVAFENQALAEQALSVVGSNFPGSRLDRDTLRMYMNGAAEAIPQVLGQLQSASLQPISLTLTQPTLDDVFLKVTGQSMTEEESNIKAQAI
ncbi:MAG: ATP-binding cassette domain-containing protein [Anaerolineales bacterium]|jgi:ABC-2 type transport system ATP-binding protein